MEQFNPFYDILRSVPSYKWRVQRRLYKMDPAQDIFDVLPYLVDCPTRLSLSLLFGFGENMSSELLKIKIGLIN